MKADITKDAFILNNNAIFVFIRVTFNRLPISRWKVDYIASESIKLIFEIQQIREETVAELCRKMQLNMEEFYI